MRGSRAPIQAACSPPPLVPVIEMRVDLAPRQQVVDGPHAVPHLPPQQARAGEDGEVAEHRVLAAHEVVAAAPAGGVPELAALALADGVPADHDVTAPREPDRDLLVVRVGLAEGRVAARQQHRRLRPRRGVGHVQQRRHVEAGNALEDDLLDPVAVAGDLARDARVQRRALGGQAPDEVEDLVAQLALERGQLRLARDGGEARAARVVLRPGDVELMAQVGRDARALGRRAEEKGDEEGDHPRHARPEGNSYSSSEDGFIVML